MNNIEELKRYLDKLDNFDYDKIQVASEDASFRKYYRIFIKDESFILMDSPPDKEPCNEFVNISELLLQAGINVPKIHFKDINRGILIIDDFGSVHYLDCLNRQNADVLYKQAIDKIIKMQHTVDCSQLPIYNRQLLNKETDLFFDWLLQRLLDIDLSSKEKSIITEELKILLSEIEKQPKAFVHRDYHSRNLLYIENNNPGIIDYQDAVCGPITYDLVSLLKDCYINWPKEQIEGWVQYYYDKAQIIAAHDLSLEQFSAYFDLMGVQRHLKASGIFARLLLRDGKSSYIKDIPRTLNYVLDVARRRDGITSLASLIEQRVNPKLIELLDQPCMQ